MNKNWIRNATTSLPNLYVLVVNNIEVGFITKPNNDKYNKNMWRSFKGIGENNVFLGHGSTKNQAQQMVEKSIVGY